MSKSHVDYFLFVFPACFYVGCVKFLQQSLVDFLHTYAFWHHVTSCATCTMYFKIYCPPPRKSFKSCNYVINYLLSETFADFKYLQNLYFKKYHLYDWRRSSIPTGKMCAIFSRYTSGFPLQNFSCRHFRLSQVSSVPREFLLIIPVTRFRDNSWSFMPNSTIMYTVNCSQII